jgi:hypothetical protein
MKLFLQDDSGYQIKPGDIVIDRQGNKYIMCIDGKLVDLFNGRYYPVNYPVWVETK